jgi:hypothetical protein
LKHLRLLAVSATAVAIAFAVPAAASTASARSGPDGWGNAIQVPGTAALNTADNAQVNAVSCVSAGNCLVGGFYTPGRVVGAHVGLPFVAQEVNGTWHNAIEVPGGFTSSWQEQVSAISCTSPGNCVIGMSGAHLLTDREVNGVWQKAVQLPGIAQLTTGTRGASISTLSCGAPGNCSLGGSYSIKSGDMRAFLASETGGVWGNAFNVAGTNVRGGDGVVDKISCRSAGNCSAGGGTDAAWDGLNVPPDRAFVVDEVNGKWQQSIYVPGLAALHSADSEAYSVSCGAPGDCSAAGFYIHDNGYHEAFVASEVHGTWQNAIEVPGTSGLNTGDDGDALDISCSKPGYCSVGGDYAVGANATVEPFVGTEVNGKWENAIEVPGIGPLNPGGFAMVNLISCASPGNCGATGVAATGGSNSHFYPILIDQVNGTWHAMAVPGLAALSHGSSGTLGQISCGAPDSCVTGGGYDQTANTSKAFIVTRR